LIVADTNTIAYLYLPSEFSKDCERVLEIDPQWAAPALWRSEFRNILAFYMRRNLITLADAFEVQTKAELLLKGNEFEVDSLSILKLADESGCSAYDCEFVCLAQSIESKLVTADKKILHKFPGVAISLRNFL
jgi:predicted nucleic acid-binding protein